MGNEENKTIDIDQQEDLKEKSVIAPEDDEELVVKLENHEVSSGEHHHHHHHHHSSSSEHHHSSDSEHHHHSSSSEHHHHSSGSEHHHHSSSSSSKSSDTKNAKSQSGKKQKWYKDSKKKTRVTIIAVAAVLLVVAIGIRIAVKLTSPKGTDNNYCTYSIVENEVSFNGNKVAKIYVRYGEWDTEITENVADYALNLSDSLQILYNGIYSGTIVYKDGQTENFKFEYNDLAQPITLTEENGIINISVNKNYQVNFLYYVYGQTLGDPYARYISLDKDAAQALALGNGIHTFRINATTNLGDVGTTTYYVAINVKSCQQPTILLQNESVGLFAYGFDVKSVAYTKGTYNSWDEIKSLDTLYYAMCNTNLDRSDFEPGEYTFCFRTDQKDYILHEVL